LADEQGLIAALYIPLG